MAPRGTVGGRDIRGGVNVAGVAHPSDAGVRGDPHRAFGYFRERHPGKDALEENKKLLGEKYARAKVRHRPFHVWTFCSAAVVV